MDTNGAPDKLMTDGYDVIRSGQFDKAAESLYTSGGAEAVMRAAATLAAQSKFTLAEKLVTEAIRLYPQDASLRVSMGQGYFSQQLQSFERVRRGAGD